MNSWTCEETLKIDLCLFSNKLVCCPLRFWLLPKGFSSQSVCLSVCLFVRSITRKRMTMTLGYTRSVTVLGLKGQGHQVD